MRTFQEILKEDSFDYLVRPLVESSQMKTIISADNFDKKKIDNWSQRDSVFTNLHIRCHYLHIIKYKGKFNLSIFSNIENEDFYKKNNDGIDKTWFKLCHKVTIEELQVFLETKLAKCLKKWYSRDDPSQLNEKSYTCEPFSYWLKCIIS